MGPVGKRARAAARSHWVALALLLGGCRPDAEVAAPAAVPGATVPANFPAPVYGPDQNPPTRAAFELGRRLFYDPRLSRTGAVSCASCHQQMAAFADAGQALSRGVDGRLGSRNASALQNLRWKATFLWDGGPRHIETMPLLPLRHPLEMDETLDNLLQKLNADADYQTRFGQVFGRRPVDSYQLLRALAQFTAALTSATAPYDRYVRGEPGRVLGGAALRGLALVRARCGPCHAGDLFTDESFRNNGLDRRFPRDSGRAHITRSALDAGRFKVPSLRNVALTAPYMHDGRFATLGQVLDHYDHGVQESATLDPGLRRPGTGPGIALAAPEQEDILAFLRTLSDEEFVHNPQLGRP